MKLKRNLDKIGSIGLLATVLMTPCCFPLFAFGLTALGFGSFELFGSWTGYVFEGLVAISLLGFYFSYRIHKNIFPLLLGLISGLIIFYAYLVHFNDITIYFGLLGLFVATGFNYAINKKNKKVGADCCTEKTICYTSTITCPYCNHKKEETMPDNACQYFYECENCHTLLKPKEGDCCVFCSYGSTVCPPIQSGKNCC
ncbi:MAG: MerC domain-containing protein [Bacteroidetes bacterium]|nr:MerC domain-containing protein [Bacteroidota bacterium]